MNTENQNLEKTNLFDKVGGTLPKVVGGLALILALYHMPKAVFADGKKNQTELTPVSTKSSIDGLLMDGLIAKIGVDGTSLIVNDASVQVQLEKINDSEFKLTLISGEGDEIVYNFITIVKDEVDGGYNIINYNIQYREYNDNIVSDGEVYESVTEALGRLN